MSSWIGTFSKVSIALAAVGLLISYSISLRSYGMAEGLAVGERELQEFKAEIGYGEPEISFGQVKGTYEHFTEDYGYLAVLFCALLLLILLVQIKNRYPEKEIRLANWGYLLGGFSAVLILVKLRDLIYLKSAVGEHFFEAPRNFFAKETIIYDWILAAFVASIIILQLAGLTLCRRRGRSHLKSS